MATQRSWTIIISAPTLRWLLETWRVNRRYLQNWTDVCLRVTSECSGLINLTNRAEIEIESSRHSLRFRENSRTNYLLTFPYHSELTEREIKGLIIHTLCGIVLHLFGGSEVTLFMNFMTLEYTSSWLCWINSRMVSCHNGSCLWFVKWYSNMCCNAAKQL